jgi:uncharacterized protein YjbI with pentapeptide repeats
MNFEMQTYTGELFAKVNLNGETMREKTFDECTFTEGTFSGCRFEKCRFRHCTFKNCDLSNIIPMNSEFHDVTFTDCKAIGIDWTRAIVFKENRFTDCMINYSNFRFRNLTGLVIRKCEAKEVDFIETNLTGANFRHTDFENAIFYKTNLTDADFTGAVNYAIDVNNNTFKKTRFSLPEALSLLNGLDIIIE